MIVKSLRYHKQTANIIIIIIIMQRNNLIIDVDYSVGNNKIGSETCLSRHDFR